MEPKKTTKTSKGRKLRYPPFRPSERKEDSTMEYGEYYQAKFRLPFARGLRSVRVWLPPEYKKNKNQRFPVLYMSDGQNLVDRAFSAYGDWHLDRAVHSLTEEGLVPPILVGIDCPKSPIQRSNELNPPYPVNQRALRDHGPNNPIGDQFIDYVADVLRPLINKTFR
nr:hypothetical protein [Bacilli bacterium]